MSRSSLSPQSTPKLHTFVKPDPGYCVYELCRPDGSVFYVGMGRPTRPESHLKAARSGEKSHLASVIRKVWASGQDVEIRVPFVCWKREYACLEEIRRIAFYGRANLTNQTDGGDGNRGQTLSKESREKLSASQRRYYEDPKNREKTSQRVREGSSSEESRVRRRAAQRRRREREMPLGLTRHSEETRKKISEKIAGSTWSTKRRAAFEKNPPRVSKETREKLSESGKGRVYTGEALENIRAGVKKGWETRRKNATRSS